MDHINVIDIKIYKLLKYYVLFFSIQLVK